MRSRFIEHQLIQEEVAISLILALTDYGGKGSVLIANGLQQFVGIVLLSNRTNAY